LRPDPRVANLFDDVRATRGTPDRHRHLVKTPGDEMNAIDLLETQHREVDELFEKLEAAPKGDAEKKELFGQIADALAVHTEIEEKIFYPLVRRRATEAILEHSVEEHLEVKKLIAAIIDLEPEETDFDSKCAELKEDVLHHVAEERAQLFPKVRELFAAADLDELGEQMEELVAELMAEGPVKNLEAEVHASPQ